MCVKWLDDVESLLPLTCNRPKCRLPMPSCFSYIQCTVYMLNCIKLVSKKVNLCSFCETVLETLHHLLFLCSYLWLFWSNYECYWLSLKNERIQLPLQDVVVRIISSQNSSLVSLLIFFSIIGKLYLWDCRRDNMHHDLQRFKVRLKLKPEIEHFISVSFHKYVKWLDDVENLLPLAIGNWPKCRLPMRSCFSYIQCTVQWVSLDSGDGLWIGLIFCHYITSHWLIVFMTWLNKTKHNWQR